MKQWMKFLVLAGAAATVLVGCGDDNTTVNPQPTTKDSSYVRFKANDKFTYNYYPHDVNDNRDNSGKLVKVWTVLSVNQTIGERTGVAVVQEQTFQADGTTPVGPADTFDFHADTDGDFSQYNLLRSVVKLIPGAGTFLDSVPARWILIGNTKTTTATTWGSIDGGPIDNLVTILGTPTTVTLAMNAAHKGKQSVTVPSGTYANAFHTDHKVILGVSSLQFNTKDTLQISYDITPNEGIVRQTFNSRTFSALNQPIPGFDMELVSITRAQ